MRRPHPIDYYVGMTKYFLNLEACEGRVLRPKGFRVIELSEPSPGPSYVYLLLKEGIDTIHALREIRRRLGGKWYHLGLKDANGVTLQLLSSDVVSEGLQLRLRKGCLVLTPLGRGSINKARMWGNAFVIDLQCSKPHSLEGKVKVPGYFSYQRFGTARPVSHVVGKMILLERWEEAVEALLGEPTPWESEAARRVRLEYYSEGPRAYLRAPKFMDVERRVAFELLRGSSPKRALKKSGLTELFLHAYQSYLYNKRLSEFDDPCEGPEALPGPGRRATKSS